MGKIMFVAIISSSMMASLSMGTVRGDVLTRLGVFFGWFLMLSALDWVTMVILDGVPPVKKEGLIKNITCHQNYPYYAKKCLGTFGRLAVAYYVASLSSTLFLVFLFEKDINHHIAGKVTAEVSPKDVAIASAREKLSIEQQRLRSIISKDADTAQLWQDRGNQVRADEIRSGITGYKDKLQDLENPASTDPLVTAVLDAKKQKQEAVDRHKDYGLGNRNRILDELARDNPLIRNMFIIFFLVEIVTLGAKLLMKQGDQYDEKFSER